MAITTTVYSGTTTEGRIGSIGIKCIVMIVFILVREIFTKHDNKVLSSKFSSKVVVADNIRRKFSTSKLGMAN